MQKVIPALLLVLSFPCSGSTVFFSCQGTELKRVQLAHGTAELRISGADEWEANRPILCSVTSHGKPMITDAWFDYDQGLGNGNQYVVLNEAGPVVGVARESTPNLVTFIVDLRSGRAWPSRNEPNQATIEMLLLELRDSTGNPDVHLEVVPN